MGMSIYEMFDEDTPVSLQVGKGVVNFRFNSARLSPVLMNTLASVEGGDDSLRSTAESLLTLAAVVAEIVTWWDVIGHDGHAVPLSPQAVAQLPLRFLKMVLEKITEISAGEAMPGEKTKSISGEPSFRQATPVVLSRNGTRSSSPPTGSTSRPGSFFPASQKTGQNGRRRPW